MTEGHVLHTSTVAVYICVQMFICVLVMVHVYGLHVMLGTCGKLPILPNKGSPIYLQRCFERKM